MQCLSSTISLLSRFLVFCFLSHVSGKPLSEKMILLEFKSSVSDPYGLLSSWKASSSNYCSWVGVTCNSNSKVSGLNIAGGNTSRVSFCSKYNSVYSLHEFGIRRNCSYRKGKLVGELSPVIGKLSELRVLSLPFNELKGEIPSEIWGLKKLEMLDLEGNLISGKFPGEFSGLRKLRVLNLGFNEIFGEISGSLSKCRNLEVLNLSSNRISGQVDEKLGDLKSLSVVDLSHNKLDLDGLISFNLSGMKNLKYLSLDGNSISGTIRDRFLESTPAVALQKGSQNYVGNQSDNDSKSREKGLNAIQITMIVSGTAVVAVLLAFFVVLFYVRKWKTNSRIVQVSVSPDITPDRTDRKEIVVFNDIGVPLTLEKVVHATGDFNSTSCIGNGGFGSTYKAEISPGTIVAVKKLTLERCQGIPQFEAEIRSLKRVRHPNLITLVGYYASKAEMFLIYNYLPGGNLEQFIQERVKRAVDWRVLHKIALDIASAIDYLHNQCNPRVLHRDIKPSNILLDEELNAYLSDFGVSRLLGDAESHATTGVTGTFGYVAPEYALTCRVTEKADVYSYGVVLLELISDKRSLDPSFSSQANGFTIVSWAFMLMRSGQAKEVFSADLWAAGPQDILVEILNLATMCTVESLSDRPTMKQVVRRLKQLLPPSG